jgi:hypothetical protein
MTRRPSGKKKPQVVRPAPLDSNRCSLPSARIVNIWSQACGARVDWKISREPLASQYASAF